MTKERFPFGFRVDIPSTQRTYRRQVKASEYAQALANVIGSASDRHLT